MISRRLPRITQCQRRVLRNVLYLLTIIAAFFTGNFITLISEDPSQCDVRLCTEKIKRASIENSDQWISEWEKSSDGYEKTVFLLILILSSPSNYKQREAIRQTWLKDEKADTSHYFAIGTAGLDEKLNHSLNSESKKFGDLLLLSNFHDAYLVLAKKLIASLVYVHYNVKFRFLLKCDDDTFVNLPRLHVKIKDVPYKRRLYWGFFDGDSIPKKRGKWKENEWLLCDHYIPYALGGGYIISSDLVAFIAKNSRHLQVFNSEDVSMAVWLTPINVHKVHEPLFDTEFASRGCNNKYLITHKQSPAQMREKHKSLLETGRMCKKEFQVRISYNYDWKVPPSQCCKRNDPSIP